MLRLPIKVNTKQRLRLRRLMYLLTAVLAIVLGPSRIANLARAQARESGRISNSSCSRDNAINMIRGQIDAAKLIDQPVKRISVLMRAADLLWPYDQKRSRAAFAEAFDIAIVNFKEQGDNPKKEGLALLVETPDQRYVVIRAVARRDQIWARKLTETLLDQEKQERESSGTKNLEQDLRTEAKLLDASASLLSSDIDAALAFARLSLRYPAGFQLAGFLYRFAEIDRTAADQFYREAIAVYSDQPLSQLLYLSAYPFGNNRAAADMPVNAIYSVPADFIPNSSLQRLFLQTLLTRAQLALQGQSDRVGFNGISDDGQIWLALTRLAPQLKNLGSDIGQTVEQARSDVFAILTPDAQQAVRLGVGNQEPPPRTLDEKIESAERETNPDRRDQLIVNALLRASDSENLERVLAAADKLSDSNLRQQLLNWLYFDRSQRALNQKRLEAARTFAAKVAELDQRAFLYSEIAKESLRRIESQGQARDMLEEIITISEKAPRTIVTARTLLAVALLYTKIDLGRSISLIGDAIKNINELEDPDFSRQSLSRRIEGKNFARYATFQTPGLSPENTLRELGKSDYDDALYQANSLSDKSLRALAVLALADVCLQQAEQEQKNARPKAGPSS